MKQVSQRWQLACRVVMILLAVCFCAGPTARAQVLRIISEPGHFYVDDKSGNGIVYNYAAYTISNNTVATLPSIYVVMTNIVATNRIQLAVNDSGVRNLGTLAPGQTKIASFYMRGPSMTGTSDSLTGLTNELHTIRVLNGPVGVGSTLIQSNFGYSDITFVIEASANKVVIITNLNPNAVLGSLVPLVIGGQSGTIGSPPTIAFSPAVMSSWRPDAYELEQSVVVFDLNPSYTNLLYMSGGVTPGFTNFGANNYTNTYYFRARKVTGTNVAVSPFGFIASGTQVKHTALTSLTDLGPTNSVIVAVTNATTINHTVSPISLNMPGGTVTYTITISNLSPFDLNLDEIIDVLPGSPTNVTFISNSAIYNSVALTNPLITGQTLRWARPFPVSANSTSVLTFQATAPAMVGQYTNRVTGIIGAEQIDTTLNTTNDNPSLSVFSVVPVTDIGVSKTAPTNVYAGANFNYTIIVTNLGPSASSSITVTDALPAGVTYISSTPTGALTGNQLVWSNLAGLAVNTSTSLTVTVQAGSGSATLTNIASGSSTGTDPNLTNNASGPVLTSVTPAADIGVSKSGPAIVTVGSSFNYTITVTNAGPSAASGVTVTDDLPASLAYVSSTPPGTLTGNQLVWTNLGTLAANATTNLTITVQGTNNLTVTNIATAGSSTADLNSTNNTTAPVITSITPTADVVIGKSAPATVSATSNLTYTISVTNLGPSMASGVVVTDALPAGVVFVSASSGGVNNGGVVDWTLGSLDNGAATNLTVTVIVPASGSLTNTAVAGTSTPDPNPTNNVTPPAITSITPLANIAISKSAPPAVPASSNVTYTISVTNLGPSMASGVVVTDALPAGVVFVSATGGGVNNGGVVDWTLGTLANGQVSNLSVTVTAPANGTLTNTAIVSTPTLDPEPTNNVTPPTITSVTPIADVVIGKSAPPSVQASSNLTYTISVTNLGPSMASGVVVTDALPAGVIFVSASGGGINNGGIVDWAIGTLANGQFSNVTVTVTAPADGSLTNIALVGTPTTDPNPTNNVTTPVLTDVTGVADIVISKAGPPSVIASSNLTYTISVTNLGPSLASGVVVTDALPAGVTFVSASDGGVNNAGVVDWTLGTLTNGQVSTVTVTVTAPADGNLTNTVTVGTPTTDPNPTNNVATPVLTAVTPIVDVVIGKFGPPTVQATSNLTYTISVTNLGPSLASGVVVTDALPAGVTFVSASGGGVNNGGVVDWALGTLTNGQVSTVTVTITAPAMGNLTNTVIVSTPTTDMDPTNNVSAPVITLNVTNGAPLALDDAASTPKNISVTIPALANDTDPNGDTLSLVNVNPTNGTANIVGTNVVFTPATNFTGVATVGYEITDGNGGSSSALITISVTNRPPVATDDIASTPKNVGVTVPVLGNDTDPDGDSLTIVGVSPTNGTASIVGTNVLFTPATNFTGTATVGYIMTDNDGGTNSALITISVTNRPPDAGLDFTSTAKNLPITIAVLVNDSDPDGDPLTITLVTPTTGIATIVGTNILFEPATNYTGTTFIGYEIDDGFGGTNTTLVTIDVTNRAPTALDDAASTAKNIPVTIPVLVNDTDPDGDPLTIISVNPTNGTASIVGTNVLFTPATNFTGTATVGYSITDGDTGTNSALITISVTNSLLVAVNDTASTPKNVSVTIPALANDSDFDGDPLSLVSVSPTNGTASIVGTNVFFTPATNFTGFATVGYQVTDGLNTNSALITISVTNRPPDAGLDFASTAKNLPITIPVLVNDSDPDGDPLTITLVTPTTGIATIVGTNILFEPATNYTGTTFIGYEIDDGFGGTNTTLVTIDVTNRAPTALDDAASTAKNIPVTIPVLVNDTDPDGDPLTIISVNPTNGTASIVGTNVFFTPATNFTGTATVGYSITDGDTGTNSALITINVTNSLLVAVNDVASTPKNVSVTIPALANDSDPDGDPLSLVSVSPTNGTASIVGTNVFFTPATNFTGSATVGYQVTDGLNTNSALITIAVTNRPPVAADDAASTPKNVAITIPVLSNDTDPDTDPLTIISVNPTNGTASIVGTNVLFTPATNFTGTATVGYVISDGDSGTNSALITITVTNSLLVALDDTASTPKNVSVTIPALANDSDPDGDPLSLVSVSPTNGTASIVGTNVFFTPATNFTGSATVGYQVTDGVNTNSALITIAVTNRPPVAADDAASTPKNVAVTIPVLVNDTDPDNDSLTIVGLSPTNGTASIVGTNVLFTPATNFIGSATVGYVITDGGSSNSALITISVTNRLPVAVNDTASTAKNLSVTVPALANDSDPDNDTLALASVSPTNGTASIVGTNILFTPATNFLGTATVGYVMHDGSGGTNSALVTINVTNRPPVAANDTASTPKNTSVTIPALANDSDPDGDALSIVSVTPTNGTASIVGTNILFTPATNFLGAGTIGYVITDGSGGSNSALITINVTNRAPVAVDDAASTPKNVAVLIPALANDSDPDGDVLSLVTVSPTNGAASIVGTNILFTPATNFSGSATVGYTITDGSGGSNSALITITVTNRSPVAVADAASTTKNTTVTVPVLINDTDPDNDPLSIVSVSPTNGTASIVGTNIVFTPATNFLGTATVGYLITDSDGGTNGALVTITVTNRVPAAVNDIASTPKNTPVSIPVLANDSDPDNDPLSLIGVSPTNGTASIVGTNVLFTPATNFTGNATVGYTITDGSGGTNSALITISVTNRPPVAINDTAGTPRNTGVTIPVLVNDTDPDGDPLSIVGVSPTNGVASIVGTNVMFTPATNFTGNATVGYTITDGSGGTNSALISVSVTNRLPTADNQSVSTPQNTAIAITLAGSDPDGDSLTFVIAGSPANGSLSLLNTNSGAVTYTPNSGFSGSDSFTFQVNDGTALSATATVSITVFAQADVVALKTGPANGVAGSNLVYTITVTNLGPSTATNVVVFDQLPAGFTLVSTIPATATLSNDVVFWPPLNLAANGGSNFTVVAYSDEGGLFTNVAFTLAETSDPNPTNNNGSLTNSRVTTLVTPRADVAVLKSGSTNAYAGSTIVYTVTVTNLGPSTATNLTVIDTLPSNATFQSASGSHTLSNGVVRWPVTSLAPGAALSFTINMTVPASGTLLNIGSATSETADPSTNNNNGSAAASRVTTTVVPVADLAVSISGPTNVTLGESFVYTITVTNLGPSTAVNIVTRDFLPTNVVFVSATGGGVFSNANNTVNWPPLPSLPAGGSTNYSVTVTAPVASVFTNLATATAATFDPDTGNNTGSIPTTVAPAQLTALAGNPVFNPQTGLFEQSVVVTNNGLSTVAAFRLFVSGLRPGVTLWNATGTNAGVPYVQYNSPLNPAQSALVRLEFYVPDRRPFSNTLTVVAILPPAAPPGASGGVAISRIFADNRVVDDMRIVIEFTSIPGRNYTIIYSDDLLNWTPATPSVNANANVTQWYDDGPPKTRSKPASVTSRYYRVILNP